MKKLQRLSSTSLRLPNAVFERLGGTLDRHSVTWSCERCGPILPNAYENGYIRAKCACERIQIQKEKDRQARLAIFHQQQQQLRESCAKCYTWLGEHLERLSSRTFDGYQQELFPRAYNVLLEYAHSPLSQGSANMIIYGGFGTGKTHLMAATLNVLNTRLIKCRFMTGQGLFDAIGRSIASKQSYQHLIDEASQVPILAIDDIDKVHIPKDADTDKNFQVDMFFNILNKRYVQQLSTLITTNCIDISTYVGAAAFSRLKENGVFLEMNGDDYRDRLVRLDGERGNRS